MNRATGTACVGLLCVLLSGSDMPSTSYLCITDMATGFAHGLAEVKPACTGCLNPSTRQVGVRCR
jgi:hypothetical protein